MLDKLVVALTEKYGGVSYSMVSFLLLWYTVIEPQLERSRITFEEQREVVATMKETTKSLADIASLMNVLSQEMNKRLDRVLLSNDMQRE